ncbi:hypothetical protein J3A73_003670 [Rhizobium sp. PvP099]|nr:hypothetical protein [Rhizobium sp. PvP099]
MVLLSVRSNNPLVIDLFRARQRGIRSLISHRHGGLTA